VRKASCATNEEAFGLGVVTKDGRGDGRGLGMAGRLHAVLLMLEQDPDLSVVDIIVAARASTNADRAVAAAAAAVPLGFTGGVGSSLFFFGGPEALAAQAKESEVSPEELHQAHVDVRSLEGVAGRAKAIEALLDALQLKAREDPDLIFPSNFNIRKFIPPNGDKPGWMAIYQTTTKKDGKWVTHDSLEYQAVKERIKATYDIDLAKFKDTNPLSLTRGERHKIGTRDRPIEHIALTSPDTLIRDALTFVFLRTYANLRSKKNTTKTTQRQTARGTRGGNPAGE
jgi:hypothetical protein